MQNLCEKIRAGMKETDSDTGLEKQVTLVNVESCQSPHF